MDKVSVLSYIKNQLNIDKVFQDEPMNKHTTFRIGGPADIMVIPGTIEETRRVLEYAKQNNIAIYVMGNGSNIIVRDKGIRGIVIKILDNFNGISVKDDIIEAEAGAYLTKVSNIAMNNSLTGMEFACGIPGTIGGALVMNAGAYDGQMSNIVESTEYLDEDGSIWLLDKAGHNFGYRTSCFSKGNFIILKTRLKLIRSNIQEIKSKMETLNRQRIEKQPLTYPSAGSVFKRPKGYFAGKLIQDAGLRGFMHGGAQVSDKHTGFIINRGQQATAKDVVELIEIVREKVKQEFGVELETEVKIIGED